MTKIEINSHKQKAICIHMNATFLMVLLQILI